MKSGSETPSSFQSPINLKIKGIKGQKKVALSPNMMEQKNSYH